MRSSYAAIAAFGAAAAVGACGKILGTDQYKIGPAPSCGSFALEAKCATCVRTNCCAQADACRSNATCAALETCVADCKDDTACAYDRCYSKQPKTKEEGNLAACMAESCAAECVPPAAWGVAFGAECGKCEADYASAEIVACEGDRDCSAFVACTIRTCRDRTFDPACRLNCSGQHPKAWQKFRDFANKVSNCGPQCGWGKHWACVSEHNGVLPNYEYGHDGAFTNVTVTVGNPGVLGVEVTPRENNGGTELAPPQTTPDAGVVTFRIPQSTGFRLDDDYFEVRPNSGPAGLIYPGVSFGNHPEQHVSLLPPTLPRPTLPDGGSAFPDTILHDAGSAPVANGRAAIVILVGDCLGSMDLYDLQTSPIVFETADEAAAILYFDRGFGTVDPSSKNGVGAYIDLPSPRIVPIDVYLSDPNGQKRFVRSVRVRTVANQMTAVWVNYQIGVY